MSMPFNYRKTRQGEYIVTTKGGEEVERFDRDEDFSRWMATVVWGYNLAMGEIKKRLSRLADEL